MARPPQCHSLEQKAFSLIELLVALALLAILVALSGLALREMRTNAASLKTMGHLRVLLAGTMHFAQEHKGYFPVTSWPLSGRPTPWDPNDQVASTPWYLRLHPYVYPELRGERPDDPLFSGLFRARYLRGYEEYDERWVVGRWKTIDFVPVYKWSRGGGEPLEFINVYRAKALSLIPFLLTGYNQGATGISSEDGFKLHCYHPEYRDSLPDHFLPQEGYLPKGTAWVYGDSILVGYADGHVKKVKFQSGRNMFAEIFNQY